MHYAAAFRALAAVVMLALAPPPATGESPSHALPGTFVAPELELVEQGLYCREEIGGKVPAPQTELGYIHTALGKSGPVAITRTVPAAIGFAFGVRLRARPGSERIFARFSVEHPGIRPGERVLESWDTSFVPEEPSLNRFLFEYETELRPGLWVMEARHGDQLLYRQEFDVVPPAEAPALLAACSGPQIAS